MTNEEKSNLLPLIRKARANDVKEILDAQLSTFPNDPANLDEEDFVKAISEKSYRLLVAIDANRFAGYIIIHNRPYRPWSSLDNLIVLPQCSRNGVGRRLLHEGMKPFHWRPVLRLFVESNNSRAIQLYKKVGFLHLQTKKNNYENGDDALIMYKFVWLDLLRFRNTARQSQNTSTQ